MREKNRLHEVVRLSGLNITIGDDDKPLIIIKVASIPAAKLQVYFIDNEDYFKRKQFLRIRVENSIKIMTREYYFSVEVSSRQ